VVVLQTLRIGETVSTSAFSAIRTSWLYIFPPSGRNVARGRRGFCEESKTCEKCRRGKTAETSVGISDMAAGVVGSTERICTKAEARKIRTAKLKEKSCVSHSCFSRRPQSRPAVLNRRSYRSYSGRQSKGPLCAEVIQSRVLLHHKLLRRDL
jgi:hypothetical protein